MNIATSSEQKFVRGRWSFATSCETKEVELSIIRMVRTYPKGYSYKPALPRIIRHRLQRLKKLSAVQRTLHSSASAIQNVCVNHGRPHIFMAKELLNGPDIVTTLQQVSGKTMA